MCTCIIRTHATVFAHTFVATWEAHEQFIHLLHYLCLLHNDSQMCLLGELIKTLIKLSYEDSNKENTDIEHK